MRVRFIANYDHPWPSRAVTNYPAGLEMTVKREVGERAIAKGRATLIVRDDTPTGDDDDGRTDSLGERGDRSPDDGGERGSGGRSSGDGDNDGGSVDRDASVGDDE